VEGALVDIIALEEGDSKVETKDNREEAKGST
jgi:hypothetical protein